MSAKRDLQIARTVAYAQVTVCFGEAKDRLSDVELAAIIASVPDDPKPEPVAWLNPDGHAVSETDVRFDGIDTTGWTPLYTSQVGVSVPDGWRPVPKAPTERMWVAGFEAVSAFQDTPEYEAMSGCQRAAESAKVCFAAMLAEAPQPPVVNESLTTQPAPIPLHHAAPDGASIPEGWQLVPKRLTAPMARARYACSGDDGSMQAMWDAMIAAAPQPPAECAEQLRIDAEQDHKDAMCEWRSDDELGTWSASCSADVVYGFVDGGPAENGHRFCHACGKPLVIAQQKGKL